MNIDNRSGSLFDRRWFLRQAMTGAAGLAGAGAVGALLEACGGSASPTGTSGTSAGGKTGLAALESAAKSEGAVNLIALPPTWANYGAIISEFHSKYGLTTNQSAPDDSSAEELTAVKDLKGQSRAPDVVDVSPAIAAVAAQGNWFAPYKVSTWSTIPSNMKDPNGKWYGDYYGVISFGTNTTVVKNPPHDWSDLTKSEYRGKVAIDGNPASAGDAFAAVWAAALANGGSLDDIMPGLKFFQDLKRAGNFNPTDCYPTNIAKGTTPIGICWDYLNLGYKKQFAGKPTYTVSIPTSGKFGNYYCQGINAYAPHPKAAQLWEEFIYSDAGQLLYLAGYAHPARYQDLANRGVIPAALQSALPPASDYQGVQFPNAEQTSKAAATISQYWNSMVGGS